MSRAPADVEVWQVDLRQPATWVDAAAALLAPGERELAERGTPDVRRRRLVARAALRIALSRRLARPPESLRFEPGRHGKPTLAATGPNGEPHFSVSRSGECCLIALTDSGPIGVDVEQVVPRTQLDRIVETRFARSEAVAIGQLSGESRLRAIYHCWTRKEAYLKASGIGLTVGLDQVVVAVGEDRLASVPAGDDPSLWAVAAVDAGPDLVAAVVVRRATRPARLVPQVPLPLDLGLAN